MNLPAPDQESEFFSLFKDYFDLEQNTARTYGHGHYTLERMAALAELAGFPERSLKVIHVAGTKGKGSTSFFLTSLIQAAGHSCGTYTSPHLLTVRERFRINSDWVPYASLLPAARAWELQVCRSGLKPTLFELLTVLGLSLFRTAGCEYAVVETGIGGLLDATNYIATPVCCVLTTISLDHTQLLGNTIEEIAAQKAGIIKPGVPVVCARQPFPAATAVIMHTASVNRAPITIVRDCPPDRAWPVASLPDFLQENFATGLDVCAVLGLRPDPACYRPPALPGRFQVLREAPPLVLDAAHNADSARRLADAVTRQFPGVAFTTVLGVVAGKDVDGIFAALRPLTREFILTHPANTAKGSELPRLTALATAAGCRWLAIPAITAADQLPVGAPLLFTGSFFTALIGARLFGPAADSPTPTTS